MTSFNPSRILAKKFKKCLEEGYKETYGGLKKEYNEIILWAASTAIEIISNSNALYHNVEHTILVTLVGQEILKGKHIKEGGVGCKNWLNGIISLLFHDIGYVKGICSLDNEEKRLYATGRKKNEVVELPEGSTDASLAPYHVDRGKLFVEERFGNHTILDTNVIKKSIDLTRFPIPKEHEGTEFGFPELVRAADLIGQLGDQRYLQKTAALFYEFEEIGANKKFGYTSPKDLVLNYPRFFWNSVYKQIKPAISYLRMTTEGKSILAALFANVFAVEHTNQLNKSMYVPLKLDIVKSKSPKKGKKKKSQKKKQKLDDEEEIKIEPVVLKKDNFLD